MLAVDQLGLLLRAVVCPEDDVALAGLAKSIALGHRHRLSLEIGHGERARRVEAEPFHVRRGHFGFFKDGTDGGTDA